MSEDKITPDPETLLKEIKEVSGHIAKVLIKQRSGVKAKSYDTAIGLQRLQKRRQELMGQLPRFKCYTNPNPPQKESTDECE